VKQAVLMIKSGDLERLDALITDDCPEVDWKNAVDAHGSSLLMVACQNGSKRIAKFLLRKHMPLNHQNHAGNTALHYAYEYGHGKDLGEYLIEKGADSTLVNAQGLTCYEGLTQKTVDEI